MPLVFVLVEGCLITQHRIICPVLVSLQLQQYKIDKLRIVMQMADGILPIVTDVFVSGVRILAEKGKSYEYSFG